MKVQAINTNNYQQNKPSFKGHIKSEVINDLMTKTPVMIQTVSKTKEIPQSRASFLLIEFMKAFESINEHIAKLNFFTTLETQGKELKEVVLKNRYSEYVEPLNFKFAEKCDDFMNEVFRAEGYKIANGSIEENVDILTDLANSLEKVDFHSVEAKMVLHSDNPSCIRDAIRETYKNEVK